MFINKSDQKGFGHLVILLVLLALVIVGLVSFAGWRVSQSRSSSTNPSNESSDASRYEDIRTGISYDLPNGWTDSKVEGPVYGQTVLEYNGAKIKPPIWIGKLDSSLFASSQRTTSAASKSLSSSFGEFFFPNRGTRINFKERNISGAEVSGTSYYYEVRFDDGDPNAQIYSAVVELGSNRWWMVSPGDESSPIDLEQLEQIVSSIKPL